MVFVCYEDKYKIRIQISQQKKVKYANILLIFIISVIIYDKT